MATVGIGLFGFGSTGRNLFRLLYANDDIRIRAISDVADTRSLEYLLRFDTLRGRFPEEVSIEGDYLHVMGRQIPMFSAKEDELPPWGELGVDVVVEAAAENRSRAELDRHFERGAKRVILCVPPLEPPDLTVVIGVNDDALRREHRIVSNASCTAHCVAPVIKILHEEFGIQRAFFTTVHAYTDQQHLADVPTGDKRRGRAAAENIIPQDTKAAQIVMDLLPELHGRLTGMSMNVPVPSGSVVDLVCWYDRPVDAEAINEVIRKAAASEKWKKILHYESEPIVSSDIVRFPYSGIFDARATMVLGDRASKTLIWYDNGWGYVHRVADLIHRLIELDEEVC